MIFFGDLLKKVSNVITISSYVVTNYVVTNYGSSYAPIVTIYLYNFFPYFFFYYFVRNTSIKNTRINYFFIDAILLLKLLFSERIIHNLTKLSGGQCLFNNNIYFYL